MVGRRMSVCLILTCFARDSFQIVHLPVQFFLIDVQPVVEFDVQVADVDGQFLICGIGVCHHRAKQMKSACYLLLEALGETGSPDIEPLLPGRLVRLFFVVFDHVFFDFHRAVAQIGTRRGKIELFVNLRKTINLRQVKEVFTLFQRVKKSDFWLSRGERDVGDTQRSTENIGRYVYRFDQVLLSERFDNCRTVEPPWDV